MAKTTTKTTKTTKNSNAVKTTVVCPNCGTELAIPEQSSIAVGVVIGQDSGLGTVVLQPSDSAVDKQPKIGVQQRIEALRAAGVDVSNLFAIQGANGGEYIASNKDGNLHILDDNDPIFNYISSQGTIPNRKLFRRWVMAQMFRMMAATKKDGTPMGVTEMIHINGYEYQWKMLLNELHAQHMMFKNGDMENFEDRNRWFNGHVVEQMAKDYINLLQIAVSRKRTKHCKGIPYKTINGKDIFVSDLERKLYAPLHVALQKIIRAKTIENLYNATRKFNDLRIKLEWSTNQSSAWVDAYKGTGAYFTLQNMIRFHGCHIHDDMGYKHEGKYALAFIKAKSIQYCNGEGWRMLGVLKKCLSDNNIDIVKKIESWRKYK